MKTTSENPFYEGSTFIQIDVGHFTHDALALYTLKKKKQNVLSRRHVEVLSVSMD